MGRFVIRKTCSGEKSKDVAGQPLDEKMTCVTRGSNQSSQGSQVSRWDYPGRMRRRPSCLIV